MESELALDSCIRGHHIFKNIWTPTMGEQLSCKREISKYKDQYTVARSHLLLVPYFSRKKAVFIVLPQGNAAILGIYIKEV